MRNLIAPMLSAAVLSGWMILTSVGLDAQAQSANPVTSTGTPDFSGVYYPVQQGRGGGAGRAGAPPAPAQRGGPPARPTQSAPLSDGSQGRAQDAPSLTPEYMSKWETMRKTRIAG